MEELWYEKVSYEDAKDLLKESLVNTVSSFIASGYWLKYIRDNMLYEEEGYSSLWEMAEKEFALKMSEASRAMSMNDKYSVGGNSPVMLEKYMEYNKSQLQEMLTMTEEQLEQVTADMKIQDLRKIKKKPDIRGICDDAYCSECGAALVDPDCSQDISIECPECGQAVDWSDYPRIIQEESVATSQEPVITVSDELLEAEIVEEIDVDEEAEEEMEFELLDQEVEGHGSEVIVDGEFRELMVEAVDSIEEIDVEEIPVAAVEENETQLVKRILQKEKQLLDDYLQIDDLPVFTVKKQKIIVGALANMLCELEAVNEMEEKEQPELLPMSNNEKRKEFIDNYETWPIWIEQSQTGERYYRYDFTNGTSFVVKAYFHKCFDYHAKGNWEERYHDDWGAEEYYIVTEGKHFKDCITNKSSMVEFLKDFQKGEK